jgi:hypothetical protein
MEKKTMKKSLHTYVGPRPVCAVPGCNKLATNMVAVTKPDWPKWRKSEWILDTYPQVKPGDHYCCGSCHQKNTARVHGVKSAKHLTAKRAGFGNNVTKFLNATHAFRQHRRPSCDNIDGRIGFDCPTEGKILPWEGMLDVDHITGEHSKARGHWKNDPNLLQTLCKCCHAWKSITYGDNVAWEDKTPQQQQKVRDLIDHTYKMQYAPRQNVVVPIFKKTAP